MAEGRKVRLVRCPKCQNLLPELPNLPVYQCGGCGAVLQAKKRQSSSDGSSEKSDEERVRLSSEKLESFPEEGGIVDLSDASEISDMERDGIELRRRRGNRVSTERLGNSSSSSSSRNENREVVTEKIATLSYDRRVVGQETGYGSKHRNPSKDSVDNWFVGNEHEMNLNRDKSASVNVEKKIEEFKPQIGIGSRSSWYGQVSDWHSRERDWSNAHRRTPRTVAEGVRLSTSPYPGEGPSNYHAGSSHGYGESIKNQNNPGGPDSVEYLEQDRAELLRKLDELKDQLSRSCDVSDKPKERVPMDGGTAPLDSQESIMNQTNQGGPEAKNHQFSGSFDDSYKPEEKVNPVDGGATQVSTVRHAVIDPNHDLTLVSAPADANVTFRCKACGGLGTGLSYNCPDCATHYHPRCLNMPLSILHHSHPHLLKLQPSPPYNESKSFLCDVCKTPGFDSCLYRCDECCFDVHLCCATTTNTGKQSQLQNQSGLKGEAASIPRSPSCSIGSLRIIPDDVKVLGISHGTAIKSNLLLRDIISGHASPSMGFPWINPVFEQVFRPCGNLIAPNVMLKDITSALNSPLIGSPKINLDVEEGVSCRDLIAPNMMPVSDFTSAPSPLTGSPRINPEVDVGISCGNVIVPNAMKGGFHIEQDKQQESNDANEIQYSDNLPQVSQDKGMNVVVLTGESIDINVNGMDKGSDSTNPRIEPKLKSARCCWFKCLCHCQIGPME